MSNHTFFNANTPHSAAPSVYGANDMENLFGNGSSNWNSGEDMWYLPAGAAFFQNNDQAITQTAEGVNIGGMDLLDYMALDSFVGLEGTGF